MAPNIQLPIEILLQVLLSSGLSLAELAQLSTVCHLWHQIIFPNLYDTVYISWNAPIFAARILDEHLVRHAVLQTFPNSRRHHNLPPINGLRVVDHVKALVMDNRIPRRGQSFHDLESDVMTVAFPLLRKLKKIDWEISWLPKDTRLFEALSRYCKDIDHFSFSMPAYTTHYNENNFEDLFSFSDLKYIRFKNLRIAHDSETHGHVSPSLIDMILRSPKLEYLELELQENPDSEDFEEMGWLVEAIAPVLKHTFRCLRGFSLTGTASIDSDYFLRLDQHNLVRDFLFRHPNIAKLELPWDWDMNSLIHKPIRDSAQILQGALPALRHFAGPTYLCMVFLQLKIAQNLEHLGIIDSSEEEESDLLMFTHSFPHLPNLRRLDFLSTYMLDCMSFSGVLKATPNITELTVLWVDGDPSVTRAALTSLRSLKTLNFGFNMLPHLANRMYKTIPKEQESDEVFQLALQCPSLTLLRVVPEEIGPDVFDHRACWCIQRYSNGSIDVTFSALRKLPELSDLPMLDVNYYRLLCDNLVEQYWGFTPIIEIQ